MSNQTPGLTPGSQPDSRLAFLSVVRGNPTDTELAALVTVLAARAGASAATVTSAADQPTPARAPRSPWSDKSWLMRASLSPGPDAWRRSALPQ
jgi:Acyl-CoA carboxylase epsilon subunit